MIKLQSQTVYSKALALFVALSILLGVAVVSLSQSLILGKFRDTERKEMRAAVKRLEALMQDEIRLLPQALTDWMQIRNSKDSLRLVELLGLDFVGVMDPDGHLDILEHSPIVTPPVGAEDLVGAPVSDGAGFALFHGQLAAVTSRNTAGEYPGGSRWVAGRLLSGAVFERLSTLFDGRVAYAPLANKEIGVPGSEGLLAMLLDNEIMVEASGGNELTGSMLVSADDGSILGVLTLSQPCFLEQEGAATVQIFLTVMVVAGGVLFVVIWVLLDRTILARIRELTRQVEAEESRGRLPVKLEFRGDDELGTLARRIEQLAVLLDKLQQNYRSVVEDQTEIICRFDEGFRLTFANGVFERAFHPGQPAVGILLKDLLPTVAFELLARRFSRLHPTSPIDTFQHRIEYADGTTAWVRTTLRRNFAEGGQLAGGQWVAADVTLQVEAERGVQESESQLRALSNRLLHLQDEERRRIARELHDSTAQNLSALEMNVSLLEPLAHDVRTLRIVDETRRIARDCCQELRNISYLLHPPLLDEVGLPFALRWFVDGFGERTGIDVDLDIDPDFPRLEGEVETSLFRVVQEALTNIYKHSGAKTAFITLSRDSSGAVLMSIRDTGHGFTPHSKKGTPGARNPTGSDALHLGIGLPGMRERLRQFDGNLAIDNTPHGVTISIVIPGTYAKPVSH